MRVTATLTLAIFCFGGCGGAAGQIPQAAPTPAVVAEDTAQDPTLEPDDGDEAPPGAVTTPPIASETPPPPPPAHPPANSSQATPVPRDNAPPSEGAVTGGRSLSTMNADTLVSDLTGLGWKILSPPTVKDIGGIATTIITCTKGPVGGSVAHYRTPSRLALDTMVNAFAREDAAITHDGTYLLAVIMPGNKHIAHEVLGKLIEAPAVAEPWNGIKASDELKTPAARAAFIKAFNEEIPGQCRLEGKAPALTHITYTCPLNRLSDVKVAVKQACPAYQLVGMEKMTVVVSDGTGECSLATDCSCRMSPR